MFQTNIFVNFSLFNSQEVKDYQIFCVHSNAWLAASVIGKWICQALDKNTEALALVLNISWQGLACGSSSKVKRLWCFCINFWFDCKMKVVLNSHSSRPLFINVSLPPPPGLYPWRYFIPDCYQWHSWYHQFSTMCLCW